MRNFSLIAAAATAVLAGASANAALIFLSTSNAVGGAAPAITNPSVSLAVGETKKLYVWVQPESTTTSERLNGVALSLLTSAGGVASGSNTVVYNPLNEDGDPRWDGASPGSTAPGYLFKDTNGVALLGGYGISIASAQAGSITDSQRAGNAFLYGEVSVKGEAVGQTNLNLAVGFGTIANRGTGVTSVFFGAGEAAGVPGNVAGNTGQIADALITVTGGDIPEPATLSLAALGGLAAIRRRRA